MSAILSTQDACHSMPPVEINYTAKGEWSENGLTGLKTYSIKPGTSKKAIIYIYDIGGYCDQTCQGADLLASQGFHVFAPDVMKGGNLDLKSFTKLDDETKKKLRAEFNSGFPGKQSTQIEPFLAMIAALKEQGYERVGAAGFCWGGNLVAQIPQLDAIAMVHPGAAVSAAAAEKLEVPTCLLPSMNEDETNMNGFHEVMLKKPVGPKCVLKYYKDMPHGWCASRADLNSENGRAKFTDAFEVLGKFFNDNL